MSVPVRALALVIMVAMMTGQALAQENLDRDKSGPKLFAASCVTCHKSARGLAKGRMSFTLSYYLRQHYTSSSASADTLTAYLQSVDTPPPGKAKRAPGKTQGTKAGTNAATNAATTAASRTTTGSVPEGGRRPPAAVPGR